jgi:predicted metal-dependent HD superfamily phosphohydrolase
VADSEPLTRRWQETWSLLGRSAPPELLAALAGRYAEPHRAYHDLRHVLACLQGAAAVRSLLAAPAAVELALWYHDVVYDTHRGDNEERSAAFAAEQLRDLPAGVVESIGALISTTRHDSAPATADGRFVVDIDLSILGAPPAVFDAYETAIRREYRWVPAPLYRRKRREILQTFLDRDRIFATDHFAVLEPAARANLARSIARLA